MQNFKELSLTELEDGYRQSDKGYQCIFCDEHFLNGEIYPVKGRYFDALTAVKMHITMAHESVFTQLLQLSKKDNTLTDLQKNFLTMWYEQCSDKDIAKKTSTAIATVRNQRFTLKEKANQAKIFLAIYDLVNQKNEIDEFITVPNDANMVDHRFMTTAEEKQKVFDTFLLSLDPLKMKQFPKKEKAKIVLLLEIQKLFKIDTIYKETEVNEILLTVYDDYVTLRRYLIEYGFLHRAQDCSSYWV